MASRVGVGVEKPRDSNLRPRDHKSGTLPYGHRFTSDHIKQTQKKICPLCLAPMGGGNQPLKIFPFQGIIVQNFTAPYQICNYTWRICGKLTSREKYPSSRIRCWSMSKPDL